MEKELDLKKKTFVQAYLQCRSAPEAVKLAGYKVTTPGSAKVQAHRLMHDPLVLRELAKYEEALVAAAREKANEIGLTNDEVERIVKDIAYNADSPGIRLKAAMAGAQLRGMITERHLLETSARQEQERVYLGTFAELPTQLPGPEKSLPVALEEGQKTDVPFEEKGGLEASDSALNNSIV